MTPKGEPLTLRECVETIEKWKSPRMSEEEFHEFEASIEALLPRCTDEALERDEKWRAAMEELYKDAKIGDVHQKRCSLHDFKKNLLAEHGGQPNKCDCVLARLDALSEENK